MQIAAIRELSLIDYPGIPTVLLFTQGCNMDCSYCHNDSLRTNKVLVDDLTNKAWSFLTKPETRKFVEAVTVTGGEPTIQKDIINFISKIKALGYKVKLDTNGTN